MPTLFDEPYSFAELIASGCSLEQKAEGVSIAYFMGGELGTRAFSDAQLAAVDSRLPVVLKALFNSVEAAQMPYAYPGSPPSLPKQIGSTWVENTFHLWNEPLVLTSRTGESRYVRCVQNLVIADDEQSVELFTWCYKPEIIKEIPYVRQTYSVEFSITSEALETLFPGWRVRHDVLTALDVTFEDYIQGVFMPVRPTLGLNFDEIKML